MSRGPAIALAVAVALAGCGRPKPAPAPATNAGPVRAALSTNVVHVGDVVQLRVAVDHPAGTRVELPDLRRGREIVVRDLQQPEAAQTPTCSVFDLRLTSLVVSNHVLATNGIRLVAANGAVTTSSFPFVSLEVQSVLKGTNTPPRPSRGLVEWPDRALRRTLLIAGAVLAALILAALLLLKRLLRRRPAPAAPPPPPAHTLALAALRALLERKWIEAGEVEPFYVELSGIVRTYLERRFALHAPEQTTDEFIREATSSRRLSLDHQQLVGAFLEQSDLVKFARHRPGADDMRNAAGAAERLVRETAESGAAPAAPAGGPAP